MVCIETAQVQGADETVAADMEDSSFDIEATIADFLADESRASLELPRLSTGQRKQAKKFADRHPDLLCESFGFAAERRLHLFKKGARVEASGADGEVPDLIPGGLDRVVSVKNTFIDDLIAPQEGDVAQEPVMSRSMPAGLSPSALQDCLGAARDAHHRAASKGCAGADCNILDLMPIREITSAQEELSCSTSPSAEGCGRSPATGEEGLSPTDVPALPGMLEEYQIRNTFIHFKSMPEDERIVQSMPHGMFGQCLRAEVAAAAAAAPAPASAPAAADPMAVGAATLADHELAPGTEVVIEGLLKLPAFNGLTGAVQSLDPETGRYNVLLAVPVSGRQWAKVKGDNLRLATPPAPCFAPAVSFGSFGPEGVPPRTCNEESSKPSLKLTALV